MVIRALDHVPHCYTAQDGLVIAALIRRCFDRAESVTLSLDGVSSVPSSFVNAAFVTLLDMYSFERIRNDLRIVNSSKQINQMIRSRLSEASTHERRAYA